MLLGFLTQTSLLLSCDDGAVKSGGTGGIFNVDMMCSGEGVYLGRGPGQGAGTAATRDGGDGDHASSDQQCRDRHPRAAQERPAPTPHEATAAAGLFLRDLPAAGSLPSPASAAAGVRGAAGAATTRDGDHVMGDEETGAEGSRKMRPPDSGDRDRAQGDLGRSGGDAQCAGSTGSPMVSQACREGDGKEQGEGVGAYEHRLQHEDHDMFDYREEGKGLVRGEDVEAGRVVDGASGGGIGRGAGPGVRHGQGGGGAPMAAVDGDDSWDDDDDDDDGEGADVDDDVDEFDDHEEGLFDPQEGVDWAAGEAQPEPTEDGDVPLVGGIRLSMGQNFGHFFLVRPLFHVPYRSPCLMPGARMVV